MMSKLSTKLKEEFIALLPPTIFFFVALHIVALIRVLMLKETGIALSTPWQVTLRARARRRTGYPFRRGPSICACASTPRRARS